ncbi:MAG: MOSC domain-containing protein, partial [Phycisphaerales bacterium]|nr:MOSC domain-containing protein [Phycisphaerales bacterium]
IDLDDLDDLRAEGFDVFPGATGENVTARDLDVDRLAVGDRLHFSGGLVVELTKVRRPCYVLDAISPDLKKAVVGRLGFYGKVVAPAPLAPGETIEVRAVAPAARD